MQEYRIKVSEEMELAYSVEGYGAPLIFLHGNNESKEIFDATVKVLKEHFTCICIDTRGHGNSSPVKEYHYQDMANDVDAFIRSYHLKNVTLCGFSDGGIVGLLLANMNDQIEKLIVCGANTRPRGVKTKVWIMLNLEYFFKRDPKDYLMLKEPNIPLTDLNKIRQKTLVMAGEHDLILLEETKMIAENIPGSELYIVPGESHGSYIVHNEKLGHLIKAWMEEQED